MRQGNLMTSIYKKTFRKVGFEQKKDLRIAPKVFSFINSKKYQSTYSLLRGSAILRALAASISSTVFTCMF
jgi:hypothetical protein